jgi:hypothetical protein
MIIHFTKSKKILRDKKFVSTKLFSNLDNNQLQTSEKIKNEKRKRNQAYLALDYSLSRVSYFDFFSSDAFEIAKQSKYFAQFFEKQAVTTELLLLACFHCESSLLEFLKPYNTPENINKYLTSFFLNGKSENSFSTILTSFTQQKILNNQNIEYSRQVNQLFLKAGEIAVTRFKNPVITSELIFLTLIEEKNSSATKLIKKIVGNDVELSLLRYRLFKHLHSQESSIRTEVSKNQQYFGYLLKTQLSEKEFDKLLETKTINNGVSLFRNVLINQIMKTNIFPELFREIKQSIKLTKTRKYSSEI